MYIRVISCVSMFDISRSAVQSLFVHFIRIYRSYGKQKAYHGPCARVSARDIYIVQAIICSMKISFFTCQYSFNLWILTLFLIMFHLFLKLREYVDDTEDYINIMLDDKQNHLLQMGVMLTTATLVISAFIVVAGIFGMNIHIELFDEDKAGMPEFMWTIGGGAAGSIFLYVIAIAWCKYKRLLE